MISDSISKMSTRSLLRALEKTQKPVPRWAAAHMTLGSLAKSALENK